MDPVSVTIHKTSLTWACYFCLFLIFLIQSIKKGVGHTCNKSALSFCCFCLFISFFFGIQFSLRWLMLKGKSLFAPITGISAVLLAQWFTCMFWSTQKRNKEKQRNIQKVLTNIQKIFIYIFIYKHHSREWENKYAQKKSLKYWGKWNTK